MKTSGCRFQCLGLPTLVVHTEPILYIVKLPILRLTQICEYHALDCKRDLVFELDKARLRNPIVMPALSRAWNRQRRHQNSYSTSVGSTRAARIQRNYTMSFHLQVIRTLETLRDQAKDAIWAMSSCVCQQTPKLKINGRTCKF